MSPPLSTNTLHRYTERFLALGGLWERSNEAPRREPLASRKTWRLQGTGQLLLGWFRWWREPPSEIQEISEA